MRREFIDVLRDRRSLVLTFLYPISMLIMYGYGIRYDVDNVPLTILDYERDAARAATSTQQMMRSGYFQLVRCGARPARGRARPHHRREPGRGDHSASTSPPAFAPASRPPCRC